LHQTSVGFQVSTKLEGEDMIQAKNFLLVTLICVMIFVCVAIVGWGTRSQASSKVLWEYKIVRIVTQGAGSGGQPERTMNELGADGWEFVQIITNEEIDGMYGNFLFKRAK
jgi:hypothetical protein